MLDVEHMEVELQVCDSNTCWEGLQVCDSNTCWEGGEDEGETAWCSCNRDVCLRAGNCCWNAEKPLPAHDPG